MNVTDSQNVSSDLAEQLGVIPCNESITFGIGCQNAMKKQ